MTYFVVTATKKDGGKAHVFVVDDKFRIKEEDRTPAEIEASAVEKGHDVTYCQIYVFGISRWQSERIEKDVSKKLGLRLHHEIDIDVVSRIIVREPR